MYVLLGNGSFPEVFVGGIGVILGSTPHGASPMVEWFFDLRQQYTYAQPTRSLPYLTYKTSY